MVAREQLPDNKNELKGIIYQLIDVVEEQKRLIANQNERIEAQFLKIEEQSQRIDQLTEQVNALKRHRYGKKSEKVQEEKAKPDNAETTSPDGYFVTT